MALYLTWAAGVGVEASAPQVEQLAVFARWLERTPSRKHRPGRERRRSVDPKVVVLGAARSPATVEGILAAVVEFVRFGASRGWCEPEVADRLSFRTELRFAREAGTGASVPTSRRSRGGWCVVVVSRDLADLHFAPSAVHLGCRVAGAHLHVERREDNENGALAKSIWPRVVPVTKDLVLCQDAYRFERDAVGEAAESDYLLVNLWRAPIGRALRPDAVERLFVRLSARVGFRVRPHMLRHTFASDVALATKDPALVKELLGHASVRSSDVYMHARWGDMRAAVDAHGRWTGDMR